jgi:hypothetical protein
MVIGVVSAGIRNLTEQPTRAPSSLITDLVVHALRSLGLEWDDAHAVATETILNPDLARN